MSDQVVSAMSALFERWMSYQQHQDGLPLRPFDDQWRSPCECGEPFDGKIGWKPFLRASAGNMDNVAAGLDMALHPDLAAFFGHWYAGAMAFSFKGLRVETVMPWNQDDYERLQENLIGHALMQRRLRLAPTFFLAATRRDSHLVSLDNQSGEVLLEWLGRKERQVLAPDLPSFLRRLEPLRQ